MYQLSPSSSFLNNLHGRDRCSLPLQFSNELQFNDYWLLLSQLATIPVDYLQLLQLSIETELTFALRDDATYKLYDIYNPSYRQGCDVESVDKGQWTPATGLIDVLTEYKYVRRDLQKVALNVTLHFTVALTTDIMTYLTSPQSKATDTMPRSHYELLLFLQYLYKFR